MRANVCKLRLKGKLEQGARQLPYALSPCQTIAFINPHSHTHTPCTRRHGCRHCTSGRSPAEQRQSTSTPG